MTHLDGRHLAEAVNGDERFADAARWMTAQVVLESSVDLPETIMLDVHEGRVSVATTRDPCAITLRAPAGWRRLRAHGGLQRGFRHGDLVIEHDAISAMRNWLALARLVDVAAREA